jgi:hypothetical protein
MEEGNLSITIVLEARFHKLKLKSRMPMILAHACTDRKKETAQTNQKEELDKAHDGGKNEKKSSDWSKKSRRRKDAAKKHVLHYWQFVHHLPRTLGA